MTLQLINSSPASIPLPMAAPEMQAERRVIAPRRLGMLDKPCRKIKLVDE